MNKKNLIALLSVLLIIGNSIAHAGDACENLIPESLKKSIAEKFSSYRISTPKDQCVNNDELWDKLYCNNKRCLTVTTEDFDGDKEKDFALFLVSKSSTNPILIAALRRGNDWQINELPQWSKSILGCYVENAEPGLYEHTQTFSFSQSNTNEREKLVTRNTAIIAGKVESTGVVYVLDNGKWLYVWVSD